jgi:predicted esterase
MEKMLEERPDHQNKAKSIMIAHGTSDRVVQFKFGKGSKQMLKDWGWDVRWRSYKGLGHGVQQSEIDDVLKYLIRVLPPPADEEL